MDKILSQIEYFIRTYFFQSVVVICFLLIILRLGFCVALGRYNPTQESMPKVINHNNDEY